MKNSDLMVFRKLILGCNHLICLGTEGAVRTVAEPPETSSFSMRQPDAASLDCAKLGSFRGLRASIQANRHNMSRSALGLTVTEERSD